VAVDPHAKLFAELAEAAIVVVAGAAIVLDLVGRGDPVRGLVK
jgi:hypothetical protein